MTGCAKTGPLRGLEDHGCVVLEMLVSTTHNNKSPDTFLFVHQEKAVRQSNACCLVAAMVATGCLEFYLSDSWLIH